jgi:hypothetical protein
MAFLQKCMKLLIGISFARRRFFDAARVRENWFLVSLMMRHDLKSSPLVKLLREFFVCIGVHGFCRA